MEQAVESEGSHPDWMTIDCFPQLYYWVTDTHGKT
jgi:hypothetical protein